MVLSVVNLQEAYAKVLVIELPDGETSVIAPTTTTLVRSIRGQRPRTAKTS